MTTPLARCLFLSMVIHVARTYTGRDGNLVFEIMRRYNKASSLRGEELKKFRETNESKRVFNYMPGKNVVRPFHFQDLNMVYMDNSYGNMHSLHREINAGLHSYTDIVKRANSYTAVITDPDKFRFAIDIDIEFNSREAKTGVIPGVPTVNFFVKAIVPVVMKITSTNDDMKRCRVSGALSAPRPNTSKYLKNIPAQGKDAVIDLENKVNGSMKMGIHVCFSNLFVTNGVYETIIDVLRVHEGIKDAYKDEKQNPMIGSIVASSDLLPPIRNIIDKVGKGQRGTCLLDVLTCKMQPLKVHFSGSWEADEDIHRVEAEYGPFFTQKIRKKNSRIVFVPEEKRTNSLFFKKISDAKRQLNRYGRSANSTQIVYGLVDPSIHLPVYVGVYECNTNILTEETKDALGLCFYDERRSWKEQIRLTMLRIDPGASCTDLEVEKNLLSVLVFSGHALNDKRGPVEAEHQRGISAPERVHDAPRDPPRRPCSHNHHPRVRGGGR
ncbi:hypothetical protein M951_chr3172 (nucleomorph) [Lotharella oceanica]|uniref:Uncharacterized protein n=1 Tax=Lotharella oceanica TaxID=641309 RepID=A0A060DAF6_9EUKA|nr:hypothetical protein M951_chr133 [Lotharella oceanica]AIB09677.1 hypothetical protein M951_chr1198 [Lotharella oceanica]AIB09736.1 hypothetical protein M951_chr233 [Lotharella oceanica]AIB09880.1 hypothetical protein M951_chr2188 [Lotharella oceanica]AIB09939.1 hypothetical protein M951_chr333 [Lotharella oceanica]